MSEAVRTVPDWTAAVAALPAEWFRSARWFQAKATAVRAVEPVDALELTPFLPPGGPHLMLVLVGVASHAGAAELYQLPLALEPAGMAGDGPAFPVGEGWQVREALDHPALHAVVARLMGERRELVGKRGTFRFESYPSALWRQARPLAQTSTNSLVLVKGDVIFKYFRRVPPGQSPELEMNRFFTAVGTFHNLPPLEGALSYLCGDHEEHTLIMAQRFVDNQGDLWHGTQEFLSGLLRELAEGGRALGEEPIREASRGYLDRVRRLAEVVAAMHRTLTAPTADAAFAAEPVTAADLARWSAAMESGAAVIFDKIAARAPGDHPALRQFYDHFPRMRCDALAAFRRLAGLRPEGWMKSRVHGDFHLGQVLQVADDYFIMDFEGEPLRPAAERVAKYSPLKDVAGLLRSFNYAAYAALFAWAEQHPLPAQGYRTLETRLIEWNRTVEATFRQAYFPAMGGAESTDLPAFLAVLKLEKAVYELDYEINNRPDWLPIPCSGIQACLKEMLHE